MKKLFFFFTFLFASLFNYANWDLVWFDFLWKKSTDEHYLTNLWSVSSWTQLDFRLFLLSDWWTHSIIIPTGFLKVWDNLTIIWTCDLNNIKFLNTSVTFDLDTVWVNCFSEIKFSYIINKTWTFNIRPIINSSLFAWVSFDSISDISITSVYTNSLSNNWKVDSLLVNLSENIEISDLDIGKFDIVFDWEDIKWNILTNWNSSNFIISINPVLSWNLLPSFSVISHSWIQWANKILVQDKVRPVLNISHISQEFENSLIISASLSETWSIFYSNNNSLTNQEIVDLWVKYNSPINITNTVTYNFIWVDFAWNFSDKIIRTFTKKAAPTSPPSSGWWGWGWGWGWGWPAPTCEDSQLECRLHLWNYVWQTKTWVSCNWWKLWLSCSLEDKIDDSDEDLGSGWTIIDDVDDNVIDDYIIRNSSWLIIHRWINFDNFSNDIINNTPLNLTPIISQLLILFEDENKYIYNKSLTSSVLLNIKENIFWDFKLVLENLINFRNTNNNLYSRNAITYISRYISNRLNAISLINSYVEPSFNDNFNIEIYKPVDLNIRVPMNSIENEFFNKINLLYNNWQLSSNEIVEFVETYNDFVWNLVVFRKENSNLARQQALLLIPWLMKYYNIELIQNNINSWNNSSQNSNITNNELVNSFSYYRNLSIGVSWDDVLFLQNYLNNNWYWTSWIQITGYFWNITLSNASNYLKSKYWIIITDNQLNIDILNTYFNN